MPWENRTVLVLQQMPLWRQRTSRMIRKRQSGGCFYIWILLHENIADRENFEGQIHLAQLPWAVASSGRRRCNWKKSRPRPQRIFDCSRGWADISDAADRCIAAIQRCPCHHPRAMGATVRVHTISITCCEQQVGVLFSNGTTAKVLIIMMWVYNLCHHNGCGSH